MSGENSISTGLKVNPALLVVICLLAVAAGLLVFNRGLWFGQRGETATPPATRSATVIPTPRPLQPFALTDHKGEKFSEAALRDRWTMLSFGYTHCPDVCPTGLATLARFADRLEQGGVDVPLQVVFVSIDPQRDTPSRLAQYVPYFDPEFVGATGEPQQLDKLTRQLGILYAKVESEDSAMGYLMDHTASFILTDPQGRFRAVFGAPHDDRTMAEDFRLIIADAVR